jgi:Glu-tRNA(Gln) amidotransferase subunit E-like FAD-binding protein
MNDRILGTVKKRLYELIIDYMKLRKQEVSHYLGQIKETCMVSFVGDPNSLVKEAAVQVLIKIIETFNAQEI